MSTPAELTATARRFARIGARAAADGRQTTATLYLGLADTYQGLARQRASLDRQAVEIPGVGEALARLRAESR